MPASNVDLRAILPALDEALKPFAAILDARDKLPGTVRPSLNTPLRNMLPDNTVTLGTLATLVDAVRAVQRLAQ